MTPETLLQALAVRDGHRLYYRKDPIPSARLNEAAGILSEAIACHGGDGDTRTGIMSANNPVMICALLSIMSLGASAVLLSSAVKAYELAKAVKDGGLGLLVTTEDLSDVVAALPFRSRPVCSITLLPSVELKLWKIEFVDSATEVVPRKPGEFVCQFTSGVTGESRIVSRTCANVVDELENFVSTISLTSEDTVLCPAPLFHAYGLFNGLVPSLYVGATFVLVHKFFPAEILALTKRYRPTILLGVPMMYELLNKTHLDEPADFSGYRLCFSAGAKLSRSVADRFRARYGTNINQIYGSTETGIISMNRPLAGRFDVDSVGRPVSGRRVRIVDEAGIEQPPNVDGQIIVASAGTTSGYLNREGLDGQKFRGGWYYTGDVGRLDERGFLYITGRKGSFINVAGLKVDPIEVEKVLLSHARIAECSVVGIQQADFGEIVRAYVVANNRVTITDIAAFCRERLAPFKIPREFRLVDSLPRSPTGKILKKYLVGPQ